MHTSSASESSERNESRQESLTSDAKLTRCTMSSSTDAELGSGRTGGLGKRSWRSPPVDEHVGPPIEGHVDGCSGWHETHARVERAG